jgi:hypothetical protein
VAGYEGSKWRVFFRLLAELRHEGRCCNQFYFASQHLDEIRLKGFVKRALTDCRQKNYFLIDVHLLSTEMKNELILYCINSRQQAKNWNLVLFCKKESVNNIYNELAKNAEVFELVNLRAGDQQLEKLSQSYTSKIKCLKVSSEMSGLGKTYYIQKSAKNSPLNTLFLSGEVQPENIEKRLAVLRRGANDARPPHLHIKLDMMDNMILNCELLDQILFRICYLKMYPYQGGWYSFEDVEMFYLEIGNSYKHELTKHVSFLDVVNLHHNIAHLSAKNWKGLDLKRLQGDGSKVSRILNCWKALKSGRIETEPLRELMAETEAMEDEEELREGLLEVFLTKGKGQQRELREGNLNQVYGLVNILYNQLSEMEKVCALEVGVWQDESDRSHGPDPEFMRCLKHTRLVSVRLIFELANELVWSAVSEVRKESVTAMAVSKPGDVDLTEYQRLVEAIPKWDKVKRLNIIFASESMKMVYKHRSDVDREIQEFVRRAVGKEMRDYASLGAKELEISLLEDLFEAMDLVKVIDNYLEPQVLPANGQLEEEPRPRDLPRIANSRGASPNRVEEDPLCAYRVKTVKTDKQKFEEIMGKKARFNGKGYTITVDNLLKIINIVQRAHHNIPIVIMGATGCGKNLHDRLHRQLLVPRHIHLSDSALRNRRNRHRRSSVDCNRRGPKDQNDFPKEKSLAAVRRVQHMSFPVSHQ